MTLYSTVQEYDGREEDAELSPAQRLAKQRRSLKRKLGLDQAGMDQLVDTDDLIKDEDLVNTGSAPAKTGQKDAASLISDMTGSLCQDLIFCSRCASCPKVGRHSAAVQTILIRFGRANMCVLLRGRLACRAERT